MTGSQIFPITLPAFGSFRLPFQGSYFKIRRSTGAVDVKGSAFGKLAALEAGQGQRNTRFEDLTLTDASGAINEIEIIVAAAEFVDDRVTGEVSVIDGAIARTLSGVEYTVTMLSGAVVAGDTFAAQLWNPAGSGKRLILSAIYTSVSGYLIDTTAAIGVVQGAPQQKRLVGGAASLAETRRYNATGVPVGSNLWYQGNAAAFQPQAPWIIAAGRGVAMYSIPTGTAGVMCFDFREEAA